MSMIVSHIAAFIAGIALLWFASGLIVSGIERFSRKLRTSTFTISFLVLGMLTSITEISIGINSVIRDQPHVFVGNLIGGSFVIVLFLIPILTVFNKGIGLRKHLQTKRLLFFITLIAAPLFVIINGTVSIIEAIMLIALYVGFMYMVEREETETNTEQKKAVVPAHRSTHSLMWTVLSLIVGVGVVFAASNLLIGEIIFIAGWLNVPAFLISILVLSIGTNLPELFVAIRAIKEKRINIAFGDYMGSAAANTLLFGIFTISAGTFTIPIHSIWITFLIALSGYIVFFSFARSQHRLTAGEGAVLIVFFIVFIAFQAFEVIETSLHSTL